MKLDRITDLFTGDFLYGGVLPSRLNSQSSIKNDSIKSVRMGALDEAPTLNFIRLEI